jgi:hypothetical protein
MRKLLAGVVVLVICLVWLGYGNRNETPEALVDVYSPTISTVPDSAPMGIAASELRRTLLEPIGQQFLRRVVPDQAGVLWIALILALVIAVDVFQPRNTHNLDLALLLAPGVLFFDVLGFIGVIQRPVYRALMDTVFGLVFAVTFALILRALWRGWRPTRWPWQPNLPLRLLTALTAVLLVCNVMSALVRMPDDAGYFINLGAQRLRERGRLPYGDPLLTGTPGAAYGPVLYAAHLPFQVLVAPRGTNARSPAKPTLTPDAPYYLPPALATRLCTIFFQLVAVTALVAAGTRLSGRRDVGWAVAALYCGSPYILGVGGSEYLIGGMTFISHIGPAALTLAAFALVPRPEWAGVFLAAGAGAGFYPAFMFPVWAAHWWKNGNGLRRFVAGFAIAGLLIAGFTWFASRPVEGKSRIGTILSDTLGHHTDPSGYGSSPFGFWAQHGGIRSWMIAPLVGSSTLTSPTYLLFFGLIALGALIARDGQGRSLALTTGAIAAAASLIKIHPTGSYVAWCYGFLLLGLLAADAPPARSQPGDRGDAEPAAPAASFTNGQQTI